MGLSYKRGVVLLEPEATAGTLETFAAGDGGMAVRNVNYTPQISQLTRDIIDPTLGQLASVPGTFAAQFTFDTEIKGGSALGVAPKVGELLEAAGFTETIVASTSVAYSLGSTSQHTSFALDLQDDGGGNGPRFAISGGLANLVLSASNVGEFMNVGATIIGALVDPVDVSALSPTLEVKTPPVFRNGTFTVGGTALKVRSFSIDVGNNNVLIPDINASSGFALARYVSRAPTMTFDAELTDVSTHDFIGIIKAATESALVLATETVANNTVTIDASKLQYTNISFSNVDDVPIVSVTCNLNRGGTHELRIFLD